MLSHIWGIFSSSFYVPPSNLSPEAQIPALRSKSQPRIWALRLGFGPQDRDLGLETGIWASRLGFEGGDVGGEGGEGEGEGGENPPYV